MNKGIAYAVGAYLLWGVFPAFWKLLVDHVPSFELVLHRVMWSFLLLFVFILVRGGWETFRDTVSTWKVFRIYLMSAVLIGGNWLVYVWGVNAGFIVETSLGYFINPLVNVLMGVVILGERLRPMQWVPIGLATGGVLYLTISYGALPWIALSLAFTFGLYGLVKKTAPLGSLHGLTLETGILFLPALATLVYLEVNGEAAFLNVGLPSDLLMLSTGVLTTVPLLMFSMAARRIPLSLVGLLQYIAPTFQFLLGVFVYGEPFTEARMVGFGLVWTALLLYWGEGWWVRRRKAMT
jgi:chloramphenicol-sensitive protein RarD